MTPVVPDVAIVSYDTGDYLLNLLRSLTPHADAGTIADVHVWDNASTDRTADILARYAATQAWLQPWRSPVNAHHGPALDALLRHACRADWVLVLDADTEVRGSLAPALAMARDDHAFVGQIHPQMPQLYAYLAHLLVHRPSYLQLPPFRHHGAPGIDYFAAIARERRPFARVRWSDVVHHAGQGSLRRIAARGERSHAFYAFARAEADATPSPEARRAHETRLAADQDSFLALPCAAGTRSRIRQTPRVATATTGRRSRAAWGERARLMLQSPRRARALTRARKLGLDLLAEEAAALAVIVERHHPRVVVEVGTAHAGMLALAAEFAAPDATLVSAGLPPWELDDPAEPAARQKLLAIGGTRVRVHVIRAPACDDLTRRQVLDVLAGAPIDLLIVSGDRSYDALVRACDGYLEPVAPGGLVVIPHVHPHPRGWGGDGPRVWQEMRGRFRHVEVVASAAQAGFGIGVLWK